MFYMFINNDGEVIVVYWPKMDDQNWYVKWVQYSNSEPQALWGDHVMAATSYTLRRYDVEHLPEWSSYPVVLMRMRVRQGISGWIYGRFVRFLNGKCQPRETLSQKTSPPPNQMFVKGILARVSQAREFLNWCGVAGKRLGNRFWSRRVTEERVSWGLSFFNTFTVWYLFRGTTWNESHVYKCDVYETLLFLYMKSFVPATIFPVWLTCSSFFGRILPRCKIICYKLKTENPNESTSISNEFEANKTGRSVDSCYTPEN